MSTGFLNRRQFLGSSLGSLALGACASTPITAPGPARPNILVIMVDDMGFSDIGCYGAEIRTPHLDALAADGVKCTQFYSAARCCPTRASLLTGMYPHQVGMGRMVSQPDAAPEPGPYQGYLSGDHPTIAELLRARGYKTYMSGKWHVGEAAEHWPHRRGFDEYYGLISGASSYWELLKEDRNRVMTHNDRPFTPEPGDFYMTDAFTDHAVSTLRNHDPDEGPFFHYLAYTAPHWPLHAWPEDIDRYRDAYHIGWDELRRRRYARLLEQGMIDPKWTLSPRDPEAPPWEAVEDQDYQALLMAVYAAMVDRMDQGVGRVMQTLRETGADENTLVMFCSDNGGCAETVEGRKLDQPGTTPGERGSFVAYRRPWANASNTPFRWFKQYIHEGGIASPFIARWPAGGLSGGRLDTATVGHVIDLTPTCLEAAGVSHPGVPEGVSLLPALTGRGSGAPRTLAWEHLNNRAIRQGDWKLVATKQGQWELYNLREDRTELVDLREREAGRAAELLNLYDEWAQRVGV
jgi:arylsulfatase A-like enzyme